MGEVSLEGALSLEGRVAVVVNGGGELGRAIALALSARGVSIVVCGREEKPLGETVGHVVYAGGKARHVVGGADDAAKRAREVFGDPFIVVGDAALDAPHRIVVDVPSAGEVDADAVAQLVVALCTAPPIRRPLTLTVS